MSNYTRKVVQSIVATVALLLSCAPSSAQAIQAYTIPFNTNFANSVLLGAIPSGQCLSTSTSGLIVGATCSTGLVQSVTAGTNVTVTGTATNPIINASGGGGGSVVNYQNGILLGGLKVQSGLVSTSATTPFHGTMTFGTAYVSPPICTATYIDPTDGGLSSAYIHSQSTTNVIITDGSSAEV